MGLNTTASKHSRVYGLDIVRATAILCVIYGHGTYLLPESVKQIAKYLDFDGVNIFFVLSGFLIGTILIETLEHNKATTATLLSFMYRRWFRTLPLYYLILGLLTIIYTTKPVDTGQYFVFLQNFSTPHPDFFSEAWSLAVEEWFYLLIPVTVFTLINVSKIKPKQSILSIISVVIILVPLVRYYKSQMVSLEPSVEWNWGLMMRNQVITRLDTIVVGLLGAYINYYHHRYWIKWKKPAFVLGLLIFLSSSYSLYSVDILGGEQGIYYNVIYFTLISLGVLLTFPLLSNLKKGEGFIYRAVTTISLISYALYLTHLTIVQHIAIPVTLKYLPLPMPEWSLPFLRYFLYLTYAFSSAYLLYNFFEKPTMRLREKLTPFKKSKAVPITSELGSVA